MSALVSVIIPAFNRPALVRQAVEGVLAQQGDARFEIIVIDDGSTPPTREALEPYASNGVIRYIYQDNAGLNVARNHGLRLATGEYIATLDDDDVWLPFKTSLQLAALDRFPTAGFVHSNFFIWTPTTDARRADGLRTWFPRRLGWDEMYSQSAMLDLDELTQSAGGRSQTIYYGDTYYWAIHAPMVLPSAAIIRRDAIGDLRFPDADPSCGDWEFFARLSKRCGSVFIPQETTLNRSHEDTWRLTRVATSVQLRRRIDQIRRLWRADAPFVETHGRELDVVEADCLRSLAQQQLANGETLAARATLRELASLGAAQRRHRDYILKGLAYAPLSMPMSQALRSARSAMRRLLR